MQVHIDPFLVPADQPDLSTMSMPMMDNHPASVRQSMVGDEQEQDLKRVLRPAALRSVEMGTVRGIDGEDGGEVV